MRQRWINPNELDRATYDATLAFLDGRLEEGATVDWALRLKPKDWIIRMVLLDLIDRRKISEPWQSAWRLIEESWNNPVLEAHASKGLAKRRLHAGDRSGSLVSAIVDCVAPKLKIEPFSSLDLRFRKPPKKPKKVEDLFSTRLTSGKPVEPSLLKLETLTDDAFLLSLALALDATITNGLDIARRIARDGKYHLQELGKLHRVYYVKATELADGNNDPDKFHKGIVPSVKLLHAVVSRLIDIDISKAIEFVDRWKLSNSPIHLRLWAALSCDPRVTTSSEASKVLLSLNNERFWKLHDFPEIAELRARRFNEFDLQVQTKITARIRKGPPRSQWPRKAETDQIKKAQLYWAVREMQRITISSASLPQADQTWLDANIREFQDLLRMTQIDEGFLDSPKAQWIPPNPDSRYNFLSGEDRLRALETALSSPREVWGWDDNPPADWIRQHGNSIKILGDLESVTDSGASFVRAWEQFGWAHIPLVGQTDDAAQRDLQSECFRVLSLLVKLPEMTVRQAINGISHWLSTWRKQVVLFPEALTVWLKLWPIAVEATNTEQPVSEDFDLNTVQPSTDDHQPMDLDTLYTPAGKLVSVFLAACPTLEGNGNPFDGNDVLRGVRDAIIATTGRSGLIARHRMIEALPYFLNAAPDWTQQHLIMPLSADNSEAIALWHAIGRRTHFSDVLEIIGTQMAKRATDQRLDRETRQSLVFSLIIECLHAFRGHREPTVPSAQVQQMIRSVDDEVRAHGAEAIPRFVQDLSSRSEQTPNPPLPGELFLSAAAPFLQQVWPQERSLATPGVSQAFADLPATAKDAFAEAVDAIERFLVPFECWSMLEYGLYGEQDEIPELSIIDNQEKADALLRLLDLTVGTAEGSVVPDDLGNALDQIREVAPSLEKEKAFRRLSTAARR